MIPIGERLRGLVAALRPSGLGLASALLVACGSGDSGPSAEEMGMTAEEHAAMESGGASDMDGMVMDTGTVAARSPVQLTPEQERALGVTYTTAGRETLTRAIRTVGRIEAPEPSIADITPKIEGFVENLLVDLIRGVRAAEVLADVSSG